VAHGESDVLVWVSRGELQSLPPDATVPDVLEAYLYVLDEVVPTWEPVRMDAFSLVDPA